MRFGLDAPTGTPAKFHKTLRDKATGEQNQDRIIDVPWKDEERGVVDIGQIALDMQEVQRRTSFTSAPFALQMIEGVQKVRFTQEG